ncbi:TerB family tellurite resistance protein [uncultured Hoeflea sp.]|uniref:TerB family tellurite resistance protein n=1 Tax=uncultured Hoeflea sp. TaxID=538666 RepID=UPI00262CDAB3|nr:TerB family tellurite resistance protein [uncultured Hoeflea sp.]
MNLLDRMVQALSGKRRWSPAVERLSADPVALAKVMVIFRMVLADGVVRSSQLAAFSHLCGQRFGIEPQDMPQLHALLESPAGRDSDAEAFALIRRLDTDARTALLDDMMQIARANSELDAGEDKLIRRMADLLGLDPDSASQAAVATTDNGAIAGKEGRMTGANDTTNANDTNANDKGPSLADRVRGFLDQHASMRKVAHDPVLTAELLLLVRMSFADKTVASTEADAFAAICTRLLGLNAGELTDILKYLNDFGYETSDAQAAAMLAGLDEARKREILNHLAIVAKADGEVDERERNLLEATARRLGFD